MVVICWRSVLQKKKKKRHRHVGKINKVYLSFVTYPSGISA
jgi:hypothetical protein